MVSVALGVALSLARCFVSFSAQSAAAAMIGMFRHRRRRRRGDARTRLFGDRSRSLILTILMLSILVGPEEAGVVAAG
jgi:hypothetical protein